MSRNNKSVSFNIKDELDIVLLEHAEKINPLTGKPRNFSKYVKKLIEEDVHRGQGYRGSFRYENFTTDETEEYTIEVKDAMNSFL